MKYVVDDVQLDTAIAALKEAGFGTHVVDDEVTQTIPYVAIWSRMVDGNVFGYRVGSLALNIGFCPTYTMTLDEHNNDRSKIVAALTAIINRKSIR